MLWCEILLVSVRLGLMLLRSVMWRECVNIVVSRDGVIVMVIGVMDVRRILVVMFIIVGCVGCSVFFIMKWLLLFSVLRVSVFIFVRLVCWIVIIGWMMVVNLDCFIMMICVFVVFVIICVCWSFWMWIVSVIEVSVSIFVILGGWIVIIIGRMGVSVLWL